VAVSARLQGLVILEALVDRDGTVARRESAAQRGIRARYREAQIALKTVAVLTAGTERSNAVRFVLTVILSFSVESASVSGTCATPCVRSSR
jgi:hypothetical protein